MQQPNTLDQSPPASKARSCLGPLVLREGRTKLMFQAAVYVEL